MKITSLILSFILIITSCSEKSTISVDQVIHPSIHKIPSMLAVIDSAKGILKGEFGTIDINHFDSSQLLSYAPVGIKAGNCLTAENRFQVVLYDTDHNGKYTDAIDRIFINTYGSEYIPTTGFKNWVYFRKTISVQINENEYLLKIENAHTIDVAKTNNAKIDIYFSDKLPLITLVSESKEHTLLSEHLKPFKKNLIYHLSYDCKPCLKAIPILNKLAKHHTDLQIIGIVSKQNAQKQLAKLKPLIEGWEIYALESEAKQKDLPFRSMPEFKLVNENGLYLEQYLSLNELQTLFSEKKFN